MPILERHVHDVRNVAAFWKRERQFQAIEDRLGGFPPSGIITSYLVVITRAR